MRPDDVHGAPPPLDLPVPDRPVRARPGRGTPRRGTPAIALAGATDADADVLRAAGWQVAGRLPSSPYADPRDAPSFLDLDELLADPRVEAVALDGADPAFAGHLPALRAAELPVLLTSPAPLSTAALRAALAVEPTPAAAVAFRARWEPWAAAVTGALPLAGGAPLQVTVRNWPPGEQSAAELVDLVRGWCGDVVAVGAHPDALPAHALPGGAPVAWSLLTTCGATVLVGAPGRERALVRMSFAASARLEGGPAGVGWQGGSPIPLRAGPDPAGADAGLRRTAAALLAAVSSPPAPPRTAGGAPAETPRPADLGDLLAAARVLEALRASAQSGAPVPTV